MSTNMLCIFSQILFLQSRYSYDSFQFNARMEHLANSKGGTPNVRETEPDLITYKYERRNRGRVPLQVMKEIGFEDCDYIAMETSWKQWADLAKTSPIELHVPCRDPLEHLMSQCNFLNQNLTCDGGNLAKQISTCLHYVHRFDNHLLHIDGLTLKCFNAVPVEPYLEYMDPFLQRKRKEATYVHRSSNKPRNKDDECIWKNAKVAERTLKILQKYDYYRWCQECLGGDNDLFGPKSQK